MVEHCKNCEKEMNGKFCSNCGQKKFDISQKTIGHLVHDGFHFITHLEGNIFNTFKAVLTKPGKLSQDYSGGKQKTYFKPVSLFLIIVVIYLIFPFMEGMNMKMENHQTMFIYGAYAKRTVNKKLNEEKYTNEDLSEKYALKSSKVSKILLTILIPLSVLVLLSLFFNSGKIAYEHWLVSVEFNSFYIAFTYLLLPPIYFLLSKKIGLSFLIGEVAYTLFSTFCSVVYSIILFKRFYNERWSVSILKGFAFVILHLFFVQVTYRFLQFQITMWLI